tara:strand:- start:4933 stop:6096 length:1164 start_codon:yes stop_codon:yes gene_type:complete
VTEIRRAQPSDLPELLRLEAQCFSTDRLSRRSFRRWLKHEGCLFEVAVGQSGLLGYVLVILRRGTRLARLYSLAIDPAQRGLGLAEKLLLGAESAASERGALHMRLEVSAANVPATRLYQKLGYRKFGLYRHYYEDSSDALRMEKCIHRYAPAQDSRRLPWVAQTTGFTCGPAALMMAMAGLDEHYVPSPVEEIEIWREATTIFMTSGHGGCHPVGLALAAVHRGFAAQAWVNQEGPLFVEGVRNANKKRVIELVHTAFLEKALSSDVSIRYVDVEQEALCEAFARGANVLMLISTYRLDHRKAPHWVLLSGYDDDCLYVHDPDLSTHVTSGTDIAEHARVAMECQHLPIAREDFSAMSSFGSSRLRAAVVVSPKLPVHAAAQQENA